MDGMLVINDLNDIPPQSRYEGMTVYQISNEQFYKFAQGMFSEFEPVADGTAGATTTINIAVDNALLVEGSGVSIEEISPGTFKFSVDEKVLLNDGSVQMDTEYTPTENGDVVTKGYLDTELSGVITSNEVAQLINDLSDNLGSDHTEAVASEDVLGHTKIDNRSIKTDADNKLYLALTDGGVF